LGSKLLGALFLLAVSTPVYARSQDPAQAAAPPQADSPVMQKVPPGVILVRGAWSSSSDAVTPLPEGGAIANNIYSNQYFGLSFPLPSDWQEKYKGPPPSDSGYFVLTQITPGDTFKGPNRGSVLIAAQDLFFSLVPAANAMDLIEYTKKTLQPDFKVERDPTQVTVANHPFVRFDYVAPAADLHWYIFATQIRCHMVEFVLTSRDTRLLDNLVQNLSGMSLPADAAPLSGTGGGKFPVCIKDYATPRNLTFKVDPVLADRRFNPIPVRIVINRDGTIKNIHFLSAFPEQSKAITDALLQWKFKPYLLDGQPAEVETGILFGRPTQGKPSAKPSVTN
jgi:hypothetical protein